MLIYSIICNVTMATELKGIRANIFPQMRLWCRGVNPLNHESIRVSHILLGVKDVK